MLKLKKNKYYVRKNALKYLEVDFFVIVDKDNKVIGYAEWGQNNYVRLITKDMDNIDSDTIKMIGKKKIESMKETDVFCIFIMNGWKSLSNPIALDKPVRGIRKTTKKEEDSIKRGIVKDLINEYKITIKKVLYNHPDYQELYSICMEKELEGGLFDCIKNFDLYNER